MSGGARAARRPGRGKRRSSLRAARALTGRSARYARCLAVSLRACRPVAVQLLPMQRPSLASVPPSRQRDNTLIEECRCEMERVEDCAQLGSPQQGSPQQGSPQQGSPQQGSPQQGSPQQGSPRQSGGGPLLQLAKNGSTDRLNAPSRRITKRMERMLHHTPPCDGREQRPLRDSDHNRKASSEASKFLRRGR